MSHHPAHPAPHPAPHQPPTDPAATDEPALDFWERRYAQGDTIWSGRVNAMLEQTVADLPPGRALDLGSGEGGDAVWLARRGWSVTGLELSPTAVARARAAAEDAGLGERCDLRAADLTAPETWAALEPGFDLVSACFLQSPLVFPRHRVIAEAARLLAPGGHLLVVAHAAPPAWSDVDATERPELFPRPEEDVAAIAQPAGDWDVLTAEVRRRAASGPQGQHGHLDDSVVWLRRR